LKQWSHHHGETDLDLASDSDTDATDESEVDGLVQLTPELTRQPKTPIHDMDSSDNEF